MIGRTLSRRTMILSVNRAGGKTSQQFNAGSTSSCGKYINGGNPLNNYHQADYWKKRHAMCTYPVLGGACKLNFEDIFGVVDVKDRNGVGVVRVRGL